jgi:hypothetical protein
LSEVEDDENYLRRWIFGDEVTFYVSEREIFINCKIRGSENPDAILGIEKCDAEVKV